MINHDLIAEAIAGTGCGPVAVEEGTRLAEAWIGTGTLADKRIVAVECGFVYWLEEKTAVIGVQDLLTSEPFEVSRPKVGTPDHSSEEEEQRLPSSAGVGSLPSCIGDRPERNAAVIPGHQIVGNEFKTTKEPTRYWNEQAWYDSIASGHQVRVYALALKHGVYYEAGGGEFRPGVEHPRIRVRAVSKSVPPQLWPLKGDGVLRFTEAQLEQTRAALINKAASIRAMRKTGLVPWQLPGIWCTNQFKRQCEYFGECRDGEYPVGIGLFDEDDPAFGMALKKVGKLDDPELVVLGASAYGAASECLEKYRRNTVVGNQEESLSLATGTVLHAAVGEWYRQIREQQKLLDRIMNVVEEIEEGNTRRIAQRSGEEQRNVPVGSNEGV